ncbi:GNAT family N-acetyltransferase [Synechococcus sp. UW179B]|uniref:GNAT family N-acetyltransferase n=1 Tax=Synechococcus sp. UW179B TaxID=2575516 RepID=UPI000E0E573E|nr:GNAT family N-acetyltransferase [Synechococcus sp. UW179B]
MPVDLTLSSWPRDRGSIQELINTLVDHGYHITPEFPLSTNISEDPWSWSTDPSILFLTYYNDNRFIGFLVTRQLSNNIHIHALWIPPSERGFGIGSQILSSLSSYFGFMPHNTTITLHTYSVNNLANKFYQRCGFIPMNNSTGQDIQGLTQWIRHASQFQWPLKAGKACYWKYLNH